MLSQYNFQNSYEINDYFSLHHACKYGYIDVVVSFIDNFEIDIDELPRVIVCSYNFRQFDIFH